MRKITKEEVDVPKCLNLREKNVREIASVKRVKCRKPAPTFFYFDGRDNIPLCVECSTSYESLGLSVQTNKVRS